MLSSILTFLIVGLVVIVGASVAFAILGAVFGLALGLAKFLLFTVGPILLVGYIVMRLLGPKHRRLTPADREWLER